MLVLSSKDAFKESITSSATPLATKNSLKESGWGLTSRIYPIGINVLFRVISKSEPLAIYRYLPSILIAFNSVIS